MGAIKFSLGFTALFAFVVFACCSLINTNPLLSIVIMLIGAAGLAAIFMGMMTR